MKKLWLLFALVIATTTIFACGGGGGGGGSTPAANKWDEMQWDVGQWGP